MAAVVRYERVLVQTVIGPADAYKHWWILYSTARNEFGAFNVRYTDEVT